MCRDAKLALVGVGAGRPARWPALAMNEKAGSWWLSCVLVRPHAHLADNINGLVEHQTLVRFSPKLAERGATCAVESSWHADDTLPQFIVSSWACPTSNVRGWTSLGTSVKL